MNEFLYCGERGFTGEFAKGRLILDGVKQAASGGIAKLRRLSVFVKDAVPAV